MQSTDFSFAIPVPIRTTSGETFIVVEADGRSLNAALLPRIVGQAMDRQNLDQIQSAGFALASFQIKRDCWMRWMSPNFPSVLECCRSWQNNLIAPDVQIFLCSVPAIDGHFAVAICNLATSRRRQRIVKKAGFVNF